MATKEEMQKIAIRAIEDDSFRANLSADPAKVAASMGITFTPQELAEIKESRAKADKAGLRESKSLLMILSAP